MSAERRGKGKAAVILRLVVSLRSVWRTSLQKISFEL